MELFRVVYPIKRWWWLIIASTVLAAASSFFISREQPKLYLAKATLIAGRTVLDPNPTSADLYLGQQLALVYTAIAHQNPVISAAMEALNLTELPEYSVRALPNSQFIEIQVTDTIPERAIAVANQIAAQLIAQSPQGIDDEGDSRRIFIIDQLNYLEGKIEETKSDISAEQVVLADLNSAREIDDAQATLLALQEKLSTLQTTYASLLVSSKSTGSNVLSIIESASNAVSSSIETWQIVVIATLLGVALSMGAAYLIEHLDDTLKLSDDFAALLNTQVIGNIPRAAELSSRSDNGIVSPLAANRGSLATEAFHQLRANLDLLWGDEAPKTILVTSMGIGDGNTTVALNLAASLILSGRKILLVDANFRHPEIHKRLGLPDGPGFSDAVKHDLSIDKVFHKMEDPRLIVLTNGRESIDPVEFLSSIKFRREMAQFDIESDLAILDCPPLFVSDTLIMSLKVDGVLVVLKPGHVSKKSAVQMMDQLRRSNVKVLGIVLNQVPFARHNRYFDQREVDILDSAEEEVILNGKTKSKARNSKVKVPPFEENE